ncbi:TMEM199/VMA12 family vacuolar ATPase assembly factor [Novilysobacter selenitireducens]|uniref:Uncharacterized protein n=1 Tax=Novilysobacter selenitireducens TaxID=2872639 RepID=A0ABS7T620_9GAMM|nr:TMEM199/VMA12 family vacuolar ATPase assembly factor [Lysobacter selenitireducens]MBZ4039313.1 hypothetical protein [Lysobacter selenitireducens]
MGSLAESAKSGLSVGSVVLAGFWGLGGLFVAATHLVAADKAGARFLIPVIGAVSVLVGLVFLGYGIYIFLGA